MTVGEMVCYVVGLFGLLAVTILIIDAIVAGLDAERNRYMDRYNEPKGDDE